MGGRVGLEAARTVLPEGAVLPSRRRESGPPAGSESAGSSVCTFRILVLWRKYLTFKH